MIKKVSANLLSIAVLLSLFCVGSVVFAQEEPSLAPVNPAFQRFQETGENEILALGEFGLGEIPSPMDLSHMRTNEASDPSFVSPPSYDLRTYGKVTAVRNQGSCGSCWTFASIASLESFLLTGEKKDFSENNLKNEHGFDYTCCYGGNIDMAAAYFARWDGPVSETDDAYNGGSCTSPSSVPSQKQVQDIIYIPGRSGALDNEGIKQAVMTYGAVTISMRWEDSSWNASKYAYYYGGSSDTNHLVAVIGWDDNFSASNFKTTPPGSGAFLIRNSWGSTWGNTGYFWISYYDGVAAYWKSAAFTARPQSTYSGVYQYDTLGATSSFGYVSNYTAWGANMFTAAESHSLAAVSTYFLANNASYELYIYKGCSGSAPRSGTLAYSKTGSMENAGYHTIALDQPVQLTAGQLFSIVFKIATPGYGYPIPIEYPFANYSSGASAGYGQSFYGSSGSSWTDITSTYPNTNVCIKGFTGASSVPPPVVTSMAKLGNPFRIAVYGSNFQNLISVFINNTQWSNGYIKGTTKIVLKGGASLKALVPKNTPTTFRFVNQDGGETTVVFQWP
jgi:C1A family cysteine protease